MPSPDAPAFGAAPGVFIVLEGGEGVGKTTQWQRIADALRGEGHEVAALREPGGTAAGDTIRTMLLSPESDLTASTEALLFAASRAQLVQSVIQPALSRGAVVLVDRFLLSTYAYQGAGRGLSIADLRSTNHLATAGLAPDVTLLLTMPLDDAMARMRARGAADRLEREGDDFHRRIQQAFVLAATPEWQQRHPEVGPVYAVDASGDPDAVTVRCLKQLALCCPTRFSGAMHG